MPAGSPKHFTYHYALSPYIQTADMARSESYSKNYTATGFSIERVFLIQRWQVEAASMILRERDRQGIRDGDEQLPSISLIHRFDFSHSCISPVGLVRK